MSCAQQSVVAVHHLPVPPQVALHVVAEVLALVCVQYGADAQHPPPAAPARHVVPVHALGSVQMPAAHTDELLQPPHDPPQPSSPHCLCVQLGVHTHWPPTHDVLPVQGPHEPPQPSSPQTWPLVQWGVQQSPL